MLLETSKFEPKLGPKITMRTEAFRQNISFFTHISLNCITHVTWVMLGLKNIYAILTREDFSTDWCHPSSGFSGSHQFEHLPTWFITSTHFRTSHHYFWISSFQVFAVRSKVSFGLFLVSTGLFYYWVNQEFTCSNTTIFVLITYHGEKLNYFGKFNRSEEV